MIDCLIVGQGIAGSCLAYHLIEAGYSTIVMDDNWDSAATKVAAGLMTPITGKRMALSWEYPILFPYACDFYRMLEKRFSTSFLTIKPAFRYFTSAQETEKWQARSHHRQFQPYLSSDSFDPTPWIGFSNGFLMDHSGFLNTLLFLDAMRTYLIRRNAYLSRKCHYSQIQRHADCVQYESIRAKTLIFCEGYRIQDNPFFSTLPFQHVRGEILTFQSKTLTQDVIFSGSKWCVPTTPNTFKFGATYDREHLNLAPRKEGIETLKKALQSFSRHPTEVIKIETGIRPSTTDVMPYMGYHPHFPEVGVFGGFSSKGVLQAPFLAKLMVDHMLGRTLLAEGVHLRRFFSD